MSKCLDIRAYIAEHSPQAADDVAAKILNSVGFLAEHPNLGVATHRTDVRKLVVKYSVYVIPYRIVGDEIEILEVFDARQETPRS